MAGLDREQQHVLGALIRGSRRTTSNRRLRRRLLNAAVETGIVEDTLHNEARGTGTSVGWRQETSQYGPVSKRLNLRGSVGRFYSEALGYVKSHPHAPSWEIAANVQRPRADLRGRYRQHRLEANDYIARYGGKGVAGGGGGGGAPLSVTPVSVQRGTVEPGGAGVASLLSQLRDQEKQQSLPQSQGVAPPAFSAQARLPKGYQAVESGPPPPEKTPLSELLDSVRGMTNDVPQPATVTPGSVSGGGGAPKGHAVGGAGGYPLAKRGKLIGFPFQGTHTLGNWQSDRAIDIAVPVGTPVLATSDGKIEKTGGHAGSSGRFAGFNITVRGHKGDGYFFTHLSKVKVRPGQRVRRGQVIGYSGAANGVAHLHFGREHGSLRPYGVR